MAPLLLLSVCLLISSTAVYTFAISATPETPIFSSSEVRSVIKAGMRVLSSVYIAWKLGSLVEVLAREALIFFYKSFS